jgi:hypothetical protein
VTNYFITTSLVLALVGERRSITELEPPLWDAVEKAAGRMAAEAETEAAAKVRGRTTTTPWVRMSIALIAGIPRDPLHALFS